MGLSTPMCQRVSTEGFSPSDPNQLHSLRLQWTDTGFPWDYTEVGEMGLRNCKEHPATDHKPT